MGRLEISKIKAWLTLVLSICFLNLFAQTGTTFWATAPYSTPSHDGNHTIHVVVSSLASPATVTLSIPANPSFNPITISLAANSTDYFDFNALMLTQVEMSEWDQITNKGILIQSTDKITSYLEVFSTYNSDIFALKGKNALGTDFYTPFETSWGNHNFSCVATNTSCVQAYSHAEIVATEDNTTITITPSVDVYKSLTGVHPAGVPYTVVLAKKGQTFSVRAADITTTAQPAGTHITSDKPIAVTVTDDSMEIGGAYDIVGDQLTPVSVEGSQYIAMKGYLTDEYVYGVITQNTTKISVNGVMRTKTYNKGDTIIVKLVGNTTVIQSDNKQPFNMFHVSGNANEAGGAILPPTDQCTGSMQVGFNFGHADIGNYLYLNLMVRTGAETNFLVDGTAATWLTPASFAVVPGTSWSVARFTLTNTQLAKGNHLISNTKDLFHMGYINYTGPGAMYGYFSDFENMVVSVVAIKSNTDTVVACTGEPLQLRVDGGVNYLWSGKNIATNADASVYLSSKTIYNPLVLGTIPTGDYTYTVSVTSACNGPAVTKTVKVKVVQSPSPQTKSANICESSVGSGCVSNVNLTSYSTLMTNSWPTGAVTEWQKDSYNQMVTLDNYDGIRVVNYGTQNARTFNMAFPNPIPTSSVNPSATVLKFEVGGGSSGTLTLNSQANYPFDLNNGAIFQMKIMNTVYSSWSANAFRSVTMKLKNNTDSATVTTSLSKYDKWELLTFDFSALPKKVYNTMIITLNGKDWEQDVFYVDDIQKQFNYQKTTIKTPTATNVCSPEKIYALVEDANGCSANSVLTPVIAGGTFAVGNPSITLCQTGTKIGEATGVNFTTYTTNITNSVAGLSILEWNKTYTNYDSVYENFDNITGKLIWNTPTLIAASGTVPMNIVKTINNVKSPIQNTSSKVASVYYGQGNGYSVSTDLVNSIDLSQGWVFNVMASYWTGQWGNGTSTQSVSMTLSGSSGTVSVGPINIHHTSSNNQGTTDSNHIWNNVVFDFTSFKTQKGFDRITINYNTSNWATDSFYFDNFHRTMQPFLAKTTPPNQTVQNGDKVYAIVKDASGCLVKSTITFTVKDCGPPAIDQTDTMCEAVLGSGNVTAINITNYNNAIKGNVAANTVTWYSNATLTTLVGTPTNVTVTNGLIYYALVKDPGNGKQDTATLKFTIKSLPNIVFPTIAAVCEGSSTFTITGTTPTGGTWSGGTYITAAGVFDPIKATVGAANSVTYSVTVNGCSSTKNTTVTVNANPNPTLVTAAKDLLYCGTAGVPVSVSNNVGATYVWTKNGTGISGTANAQSALTSGTYAVTATLNGCSKSVTNIVVSGHDIPDYTITGGGKYCDDTVTIPGVTITLTKGDMPWNVYYTNGTTKWNQTAVATATFTVPVANLKPGTYVLDSLTNAYCKAIVKATLNTVLTEVKRPNTSVTTTDFSYCGTVSDVTLSVTPFTPTSYEWKRGATIVGTNSNSYANSTQGTYSITLTNDICKSSINNIIVTQYNKPTYTFSGGGTFCQGKTVSPILIAFTGAQPWTVTYRIDGTAYPVTVNTASYTVPQLTAGNYDISSISDNNTCVGDINATSTGSASITINPKPTVKFNYVDSICQTSSTINVTSKVSPTTGGTGVYSGTGINATTGIFTHTGPNSYNLMYTFTDVNGCVDSAKRTVKVNENPITTISPDPATICVSTNLVLDGNPTKGTIPYTHLWTDASSITTTSKTAQTITVKTITPNTYNLVYTVTDNNGCVGTDNISVMVNGMPTIVASALPTAVCIGATTTINATGATSYVWNPTTVGLITPTTTTSFYVTGTDANGCSNTATTTIIVNALPNVVATASATPICIGKPTIIAATGASTYVWNPTTVGIVNPTTSTTYYVTGTDGNGCKATSNVAVTVNQLPSIVTTANPTSICTGALSTITVTGGTIYAWDNPLGAGASKSVSPSTTISYTVTGTDINTCVNTSTVKVTVNNLPSITASPVTSICYGFGTTITANGGTSYNWSNTIGTASQTVSPTITTTYSVTGTDANNCKNTASTVITVNAIPTVLISLPTLNTSTGNYCVSNVTPIAITTNPSSVGTVLVTGTGVAGTTPNYTFTPSNAGIGGPYTLTFNYTDANGCNNSTTTSATVFALPIVDWAVTNPTLVCSDGNAVKIDVITSPIGGFGIFNAIPGLSKINDNQASFDPKTAGASGIKSIGYSYTDLNGCTQTAVPSSIEVFDTPEPTIQSISTISTPIPSSFCFDVSSQGLTLVKWYQDPKTIVVGTGNSYCPVITHTGTSPDSLLAGTYNYLYSETINGCESQTIAATAIVTNCPAKAPIAGGDSKPCTKANLSTVISATAQGSGSLVWFSTSSTKTIGLATGTTFTLTTNSGSTNIVYVAEWDNIKACFGPTTPVTLTVNPLPTPTISASPSSVCYTSGIQTLNVSHTTGAVLKGTGATSYNTFDPTLGGKTDGTYKLTYIVTDANNCVDSATVNMTVTYADVPVEDVKQPYLLLDIPNSGTTKPEVCAKPGAGSGLGIEWAIDAVFSSPIAGATGLCYDTKEMNVITNKAYYVRQTENGCKSDAIATHITIVNCPWKAPSKVDVAKCENDATLTSTVLTASTTEPTPSWQWYNDDKLLSPIAGATASTYNPGGNTPGSTDYYVRFEQTEISSGKTCWSPATKVTRVVYQKPALSIVATKDSVCYTSGLQTVKLNPSGGTLTGMGSIAPNNFDPTAAGKIDGQYTLTYVYSDANSCSNTTTHVMTVTYANALVEDVKISYLLIPVQVGTTSPDVCAKQGTIAGSGLGIEWSNDSLYTASIAGATGLCYNTNIKQVTSNQAFYVRQTENGCKSDAVATHITIVDCPWAAPGKVDVSKCENDATLVTTVLSASTTEPSPSWQWYKDALVSQPIAGATASTYNPGGNTPGSTDYYVRFSQTEPSSGVACWSQPTKVTRKVNPKPIIAITNTITHLCVDNAAITITTSSNVTGTGVFAESYLTNVNNSYATFDPRKAAIGTNTINYTFTDGNGCISTTSQAIIVDSTAPPTVKPLFQDMVHNAVPQLIATGTSLKWYSILPIKNSIGSGTPFLDASIAETDIVNYKDYWVIQTLNGCESQPSHTQMLVNACPVPMPNVDINGFKRCTYDNSPAISASSGSTWPLPESAKHGYYWYTSQTGTSETYKGTTFSPSVSGQVGVQTYYVAEYDSLYTCFGPRQRVTFTIVPVAKPDVVAVDPICFGESNKTFTVNTPVALNKYVWYGTADTLAGKISIGTSFTPTEKTVGIHDYWATRIDENNCRSVVTPLSIEIKPKPGLPTLTNDESCDIIENIKTLTATGDAGSIFEWYINDSLHYKATNPTLTPTITSTTTYYVRQNLNSCRGWFAPVIYTIKPRPTAPIVSSKAICSYNDIPSFDVTATGIVNWYGQNQALIGNDNPYTPSTKTSSDYFITQTLKGCESPQTKIHFEVHPIVSKPIVIDNIRKCENAGAPSVTVTTGKNIKWYESNDTTTTVFNAGRTVYNFINKPYGVYHIYVTQTDAFKCQSEPLDAVAYVDSVPVKPVINEHSISICAYDAIPTFTSTNNNTIQWYINGVTSVSGSSITLNSSQIKEGETKNLTVKVTSTNSCVSSMSDVVNITIKPTPAIPTFTIKDVCTNDSNQIIFTKKTGLFTIIDIPAKQSWKTDSIAKIQAWYNDTIGERTFSIYQTINGCDSRTTTAKFMVRKRPTPKIVGRDSLCERTLTVPYNVAVKNPTNSYNWTITGGRTLYKTSESIQGYTRNVDYIGVGIDTITVYEDNGYCIGKGILPVKVAPAPTADFRWEIPGGLSKVYFVNTSTQTDLPDGKNGETIDLKVFRWNFNRENDFRDSIQSLASYDNNDEIKIRYNYGNHEAKLIAINSFGCKDSITKKFFVDLAEGLYFPNSFIPTSISPGLNSFLPKGFNLETYELWIYDVWGNLIWYSDKLINGSPAEGWDGKYKGEVLKLDSYIWKCEATFKDGREFGNKHGKKYIKFGNVLLLE